MTSTSPRTAGPPTAGRDAHGLPMAGGAEAVARYDEAVDLLLRYHPAMVDRIHEGAAAPDAAPLAHALSAYLHLMGSDGDELPAARRAAAELAATATTERERAHLAAVGAWIGGDWHGAAAVLDDLLVRWPTDVVALMLGHQLDFFLGDAQNLRDRPLRALGQLDPDHPHAGFALGMAAFGLEEAGHHDRGLDAGLRAVAANPDDVWATHAVIHCHEMQGRADEGIAFLGSGAARWERGNLFTAHNWWHLALFHLEAGRPDRALAVYDAEIRGLGATGIPVELVDASALLWRLLLDDLGTGDRFAALAEAWAPKASGTPWYAFNDLHAAMAFAGAGRLGDARALVERLEAWLAGGPAGTDVAMTAEVGLPACRAVVAFAEGRHDDVVAALAPLRHTAHRFGGSHAQRDVLARTLLESAQRGGHRELARALTAERVGLRPTGAYGWAQRARALAALGEGDAAAAAAGRAAALQARVAAAT